MSRIWKDRIKLICKALFCGIGIVQVIYAMVWAVHNGNNVQDFYDSILYLSNAGENISDGWRLVGYSYILQLFMPFQSFWGDDYVIFIYIFQSVIALFCFAEGIRALHRMIYTDKSSYAWSLLFAGYILTIPVIWQMQFAILPDSLCLSLTVLLFAKLSECLIELKRFRWDCICIIGGIIILLGVLNRHYLYGALCFVTVDAIVFLIRRLIKKDCSAKIILTSCIILLLATILPIASNQINKSVPKAGTYATYSLEADLWSRFVYPNLEMDYSQYSQRITSIITEYVVSVCGETYEFYFNSVGPMLEINNPEEAKSMYAEMAYTGWELHTKDLTISTIKEEIAYSMIPFSMVKFMYNNGTSLYGHNFSKMYEMDPKLTSDYMHIGMNGFLVTCVVGIVMYFLYEKDKWKEKKECLLQGIIGIVCVITPMMILSIARFDYRIGLFSVFMWAGFSIVSLYGKKSEGDNCGQEENDK